MKTIPWLHTFTNSQPHKPMNGTWLSAVNKKPVAAATVAAAAVSAPRRGLSFHPVVSNEHATCGKAVAFAPCLHRGLSAIQDKYKSLHTPHLMQTETAVS